MNQRMMISSCICFTIVLLCVSLPAAGDHLSGSDALRNARRLERNGFKTLAMKLYARSLSDEPRNFEAHRGYQRMMEEIDRKKALVAEYESKVQNEPRNALLHALLAILYEDDPQRAIIEAKKALRLDPTVTIAELILASNLSFIGQVDKALDILNKVFNREPGNARTAVVYAFVLLDKGRVNEAIMITRQATTDEVMGPYAYSLLGKCLLKVGKTS